MILSQENICECCIAVSSKVKNLPSQKEVLRMQKEQNVCEEVKEQDVLREGETLHPARKILKKGSKQLKNSFRKSLKLTGPETGSRLPPRVYKQFSGEDLSDKPWRDSRS